jgi:hypothetical protein
MKCTSDDIWQLNIRGFSLEFKNLTIIVSFVVVNYLPLNYVGTLEYTGAGKL